MSAATLSIASLMDEGYRWLLESCFLGLLPTDEADLVLAQAEWREVEAGAVLIEIDRRAGAVSLVVSGEARVLARDAEGNMIEVARVGPGHLLGEAAHLTSASTSARVVASSNMATLHIPPAAFPRLLQKLPRLKRYVEDLVALRARSSEARHLLMADPLLRTLGREEQDRLLQSGSLGRYEAGDVIVSTGDQSDDVFLLIRGRAAVFAPADKDGHQTLLAEKGPGWLFGHVAVLMDAPRTADVVALEDCELLGISAGAFRELVDRNPGLQRQFFREMAAAGVQVNKQGATDGAWAIVFRGAEGRDVTALALATAAELQELGKVAVVDAKLRRTAGELSRKTGEVQIGGVRAHQMDTPGSWPFRVLGPTSPDDLQPLIEALADEPEAGPIVAFGWKEFEPGPGLPRTTLVQVRGGRESLPSPPVERGEHRVEVIRIVEGIEPPVAVQRHSVRVLEDPESLDRFWRQGRLDDLQDPQRPLGRGAARLTRAIRGRSVGVALGGGGALGFAHIGLLQALEEGGIPVDYVAGVSFGAVVGGVFVSGGLPMLQKLIEKRHQLHLVANAGMISFRPFVWWFNKLTGAPSLSETEIPFLPGAADVLKGTEVVVTQGSVVNGIRASSGFPGVFTPLRGGGRRLVDGGIVNNVPASMVWDAGADFVIASNIIPAFPEGNAPRAAGGLIDAIRGQTVFRMDDLMRSMFLMMSQAGRDRAALADHVFDLDAKGYFVGDLVKGDKIYEVGLEQARAELPDILTAWEEKLGT